MEYAVVVKNLVENYGQNEILKGISFEVRKGEIFALLGINGAGKTTALECIEGLKKYDDGTVQLNGTFGIQLQSSSLPKNIKAGEALKFFAKWRGTEPDDEFIDRIGVKELLNKQYTQMSTGQRRRLHLAIALLGNPDIVFLDEPTAGLDVEGRVNLHGEIRNLRKQGKTIILASHDMSEVEELCDRIAILRNGKIVFTGSSAELTETVQDMFELKVRFSAKPVLTDMKYTCECHAELEYYVFQTQSIEDTLFKLIKILKEQGITIKDVKVERVGLEQRFLEIAREE